jgi:hypothetical protein
LEGRNLRVLHLLAARPIDAGRRRAFVLTLPSKKFAVPGNSGYPELTFLVNGRYWFGYDFLWEAPSLLFDRLVVLVPPEELPGWLGQKEKYNLWKEDYDEPGHLANTRQVRSERLALNLWRSYHPFLPSKISHPREMDRLSRVNLYLEAIRPGVIFNLSDKPQDLQSPLISPFYQSLWRQDRVKLLETSYEWVYYHSHEQDFFRYLARIVQVVFEHQGALLDPLPLGSGPDRGDLRHPGPFGRAQHP